MRSFSAVLNTLRRASLRRNWGLNDDEYMKIFSRMLYIVLEQQWTSSTMAKNCQSSSRSRTILKRIAADSEPIIAENALRTSTNKEVWIASILGNWGAMRLNFRIPHTKGMWGKRKNECQGMQSFLHTLISKSLFRLCNMKMESRAPQAQLWKCDSKLLQRIAQLKRQDYLKK